MADRLLSFIRSSNTWSENTEYIIYCCEHVSFEFQSLDKFSNIFCENSHRTHFMYVTKSFRLLRVFWVNSHPVVLQLWEATVYFCLLKWGKQYASPYRRLECAMFNMIKEVPLMRLFAIKFLDYSNLILRIIITTYFTQACKVWSH